MNKKKTEKFSKEIENFLKLGGSGCWEGNLDEIKKKKGTGKKSHFHGRVEK